jgi:hypothetical protein
MRKLIAITPIALTIGFAASLLADDAARLLTVDHYVKVKSTVPAIDGRTSQVYVREVVQASTALRGGALTDRSRCSSMARARPPKSPSTFPIRTTVG